MKESKEGVKVEYLGGSRIAFTCPVGHRTVETIRNKVTKKPFSPATVEMMARYWGDRISYKCKKC